MRLRDVRHLDARRRPAARLAAATAAVQGAGQGQQQRRGRLQLEHLAHGVARLQQGGGARAAATRSVSLCPATRPAARFATSVFLACRESCRLWMRGRG